MNEKFRLLVILYLLLVYSLNAQQMAFFDTHEGNYKIQIDPIHKKVSGQAQILLKSIKAIDSFYLDAKEMNFKDITLNDKLVLFENTNKKLIIHNEFNADEHHVLKFDFEVQPKQTIYFFGWEDEAPQQVWTQGQGKYTSHWLPSFDDVNQKMIFNLSVDFRNKFTVITNGVLSEKLGLNDSITRWDYRMNKPMSSYLVALTIGDYEHKEFKSESGIPMQLYYYPKDSLQFEPTYRYSQNLFNFLEAEIGVAYPWEIYKQVPVHDFLYAGMENTSLTIFSDRFMVDDREFIDKNYVNVNAHELAHQWFGNLVTAKSGTHHWLQEGFATYYALLSEKEVFGEDYFYWQLYEYAQQLKVQQDSNLATALIDEKASSLTFYQKGAMVLHLLRNKIGDKDFEQAVQNYLTKYAFDSAESKDFVEEVDKLTPINLKDFFSKWLYENSFDYEEVLTVLKSQSQLISNYEIIDCKKNTSKCSEFLFMDLHAKIKAKLLAQMPHMIHSKNFKEHHEVRRTIANVLNNIPQELKADFELLLEDESYATVEAALYKLWLNFPENRVEYLNSTREITGNNNFNIRMLWIVLALNTPDYEEELKLDFLNELLDYTSISYHFETREMAFNFLDAIDFWSEEALQNLKKACSHPNWRFRSFARDLSKKLLTSNPSFKSILE